MSSVLSRLRLAAVLLCIALLVHGLLWELWISPLRPGGSWWALKILPLCLPLSGLLKQRLRTYRYCTLLVWFYIGEGLARAWGAASWSSGVMANGQWLWGVLWFAACVAYVRQATKT